MNKMQTCAYRKHEGGNEGQKETEIDAWKKVKTTSTQSYAGKYTGSLTPTLMVALKMRSRLILSSSRLHLLAYPQHHDEDIARGRSTIALNVSQKRFNTAITYLLMI